MSNLTVSPWLQCLQSIDHAAIESIGCRRQDYEHEDNVRSSKTCVFVPGNFSELALRIAEGTLGWAIHAGGLLVVASRCDVMILSRETVCWNLGYESGDRSRSI